MFGVAFIDSIRRAELSAQNFYFVGGKQPNILIHHMDLNLDVYNDKVMIFTADT